MVCYLLMITRPLLVLKKFALSLAIIYTTFIGVASLSQWGKIPDIDVDSGDKYVHFLAYCIMFVLWFNAFFTNVIVSKIKSILYAFLVSFIFGIIIEILQGVATSTRMLDLYDIVANTVGIILGIAIVVMVFRKDVKNA